MTRLGHILAVLAFAIALLVGVAGGAMAHGTAHGGPAEHHGSHQAPAPSAPQHQDHHKAALAVAALCCPAAEAPAKHTLTVTLRTAAMSWQPRPEYVPSVRDIAPEPYPPKTSL